MIRMKAVAALTASLLTATALAGCSSSAPESCDVSHPLHLGLVYGATANSSAPELTQKASALLDQTAASNGTVTIVTPSGTPTISKPIPVGSLAHDDAICIADQDDAKSVVRAALAKSVATTPEVDLLGAIGSAAATDSGKTLGIVVVGSGLQTTGTLDFAKNDLLYGDPESIAEQMDTSGELPSGLKGVTVYWSGMTDVAGRQTRLTASARKNLAAIWSAVLAKAGARLELLPEHLTGTPKPALPAVTPVSVRAVSLRADWNKPLVLNDDLLHFRGGSAALVDPAAAKTLLKDVASSMISSHRHVTVTGATSAQGSASQAADINLSKQRAATVAALLEGMSVPSSQLSIEGVGHEWCGFQREVATGGKTAAEVAVENRRVLLTADGVGLCA